MLICETVFPSSYLNHFYFHRLMSGFRKRLPKGKKKGDAEIVTIKFLLNSIVRPNTKNPPMITEFHRSVEETTNDLIDTNVKNNFTMHCKKTLEKLSET